jgi:hypothetical protein
MKTCCIVPTSLAQEIDIAEFVKASLCVPRACCESTLFWTRSLALQFFINHRFFSLTLLHLQMMSFRFPISAAVKRGMTSMCSEYRWCVLKLFRFYQSHFVIFVSGIIRHPCQVRRTLTLLFLNISWCTFPLHRWGWTARSQSPIAYVLSFGALFVVEDDASKRMLRSTLVRNVLGQCNGYL